MKSKLRTPPAGRWSKGTSGNPAGRPFGSRNKSTLFLEGLFEGESEALVRKVMELALKGDMTALRLCLEHICPPRKERLVELSLPKITEPRHAAAATAAILAAVAQGEIAPGEAEILARTVQIHVQVLQTEDLARRVIELEKVIIRASEEGEAALEDLDSDDDELDLTPESGGDSGADAEIPELEPADEATAEPTPKNAESAQTPEPAPKLPEIRPEPNKVDRNPL